MLLVVFWCVQGWIIQTRNYSGDRVGELQRAFETKSLRRYTISRAGRIALFGKSKELLFASDVEQEFSKLHTADVSTAAANNADNNATREFPKTPNIISEPASGAYIASILDDIVRRSIRLQPVWEDNPNFYERVEEQTDEKLFKLLLGDSVSDISSG